MDGLQTGFQLLAVIVLVLLNGFFVATEFSLVSVRRTRIDQLVAEGNTSAVTVQRALNHLQPAGMRWCIQRSRSRRRRSECHSLRMLARGHNSAGQY
jgi:hypothetical protein